MSSDALALAEALIRRRSVSPADEGCEQLIAERVVAVAEMEPLTEIYRRALVDLTGA